MCYGYGRTRENLYAVDTSGSMTLGNLLPLSMLVADALRGIDCRCPRWASVGYSWEPAAGDFNRFLNPQVPFSNSLIWPAPETPGGATGSEEQPLWSLRVIAHLWGLSTERRFHTTLPRPGHTAEHRFPGFGGLPLRSGRPPRRVLFWLADERIEFGTEHVGYPETRDALIREEITVVPLVIYPQGEGIDWLGLATDLAAATGGFCVYDIGQRAGHFDPPAEFGGPPTWQYEPEKAKEVFAEITERASALRWHKSGYPYTAIR